MAEAAGGTDLFRGLDEGDLYHLARLGRLRSLSKGDRLIRQGDAGDRLFILASGALAVRVKDTTLGRIKAGETVGEIALLDPGPRSADVTVTEEATVVEFRRDELMRLMDERPRLGRVVMNNLAAELASRLRRTDMLHADTPTEDS